MSYEDSTVVAVVIVAARYPPDTNLENSNIVHVKVHKATQTKSAILNIFCFFGLESTADTLLMPHLHPLITLSPHIHAHVKGHHLSNQLPPPLDHPAWPSFLRMFMYLCKANHVISSKEKKRVRAHMGYIKGKPMFEASSKEKASSVKKRGKNHDW